MKPSRAMITGELSWAWIALGFAWSGSGLWPFGDSYLHMMLDKRDLDTLWVLAIGVPAALLMFASAREFIAYRWPPENPMRRWTIIQLEWSAKLRGRLCFALAFSWAYVFYVLVNTSTRPSAILPVAVGGFLFMMLFWIENRRVQRDIRKQTSSFPAVGA